jgi:hypothetical protein
MSLADLWTGLQARIDELFVAAMTRLNELLSDFPAALGRFIDWLQSGHHLLTLTLVIEALLLALIGSRITRRFRSERQARRVLAHNTQRISLRQRRTAADRGDAIAQNDLGSMYAAGDGIPRDYVRAHMWLSLAIAQGHDAAERSRGDIARSMTPEQIAEAEQLARQWQPRAI